MKIKIPNSRSGNPALLNESRQRLPNRFKEMLSRAFRVSDLETAVKIVDDAAMCLLHSRYKQKKSTTDVLSFETGDIVVNIDAARRQAKEQGHSLRRELIHLAVHGLLHLMGRDDATSEERASMETETVEVLDQAGIT